MAQTAKLALEDGTVFTGISFGAQGEVHGEVCFNTSMTGYQEIISRNHGFAVEAETLPEELEVTHVNLNDQTIEGVRHRNLPALSVQYHLEASAGPHDSNYLFGQFREMLDCAESGFT